MCLPESGGTPNFRTTIRAMPPVQLRSAAVRLHNSARTESPQLFAPLKRTRLRHVCRRSFSSRPASPRPPNSRQRLDHMEQIPCPDGYLLDARSSLAEGHHAVNTYLVRVEEAGWNTALKEVNGIRDKRLKLLIWRALIEHMLFLRDHYRESPCLSPLRGLAERIE